MPNYEIYYGDVVNVLTGMERGEGRQIQLDSTDYKVKFSNKHFYIMRDFSPIGHIRVEINGNVAELGKLDINEEYRRGSGLSTVLVLIAIIYGVRSGATQATLSEDITQLAQMLWANVGLQFGVKAQIASVLSKLDQYQESVANKLGLFRMPRTVLLNTDRPKGSEGGEVKTKRGRSSSFTSTPKTKNDFL